MKIVQVAVPETAGGLERVVESLSVGMHERGHDVTVAPIILNDTTAYPLVEALRSAGVRVHVIRVAPRAYLAERRKLAELLRSIRPDIVHTHGYRVDLLERPVAARLGIATMTTVHGFDMTGGLKGAFFEWLQRRNFRKFSAVAAVSRVLHDWIVADGVPVERMHHIPNAWAGLRNPLPRDAARRALGIADSITVVGWVGRLVPVKGADIFLRALGQLPVPRPLGVVIGYGQDLDRLHGLSRELGLDDSVRFFTEIRDAGRYFAAFDTYVLSSRSEGLPISLFEAMAAKVPIVASRIGGVAEALGDEEALLVPKEDPGALAEAIAETLRAPESAAVRTGRAANRLHADYSIDAFLDRYEHAYRSAMGDVAG